MEEVKNKNIHIGHRMRMKEKALKYGFEHFDDHEVLEMILYFAVPQKDTNPIAHELINSFGSFYSVFEADEVQLLSVKGMNKSAAFLIKMMPEIFNRYMSDKNSILKAPVLNSSELAYEIFAPKYIGKKNEVAYALFMNNSGKVLACEAISDGTVNSTEIHTRKIIEYCIKYNATQVILAHNHPSGDPSPSMDDFITTKNIGASLKSINVRLLDHIIITHNDYRSMRSMQQFANAFN